MPGFTITPTEASFVASLLPLGALFGGPLASLLLSRLGRRTVMLLASSGFAVAYILLTVANATWMLLVGRFFAGKLGHLPDLFRASEIMDSFFHSF